MLPASGFWLVLPVAWRIWRGPASATAEVGQLQGARG
jgi:hypothetical protein